MTEHAPDITNCGKSLAERARRQPWRHEATYTASLADAQGHITITGGSGSRRKISVVGVILDADQQIYERNPDCHGDRDVPAEPEQSLEEIVAEAKLLARQLERSGRGRSEDPE